MARRRIIVALSMSEEVPRSAHSPGRRRSDGAPSWWPELDRTDLPDDEEAAGTAQWAAARPRSALAAAPRQRAIPSRKRAWLINIAALVVALGVIMFGVGVDSPHSVIVVALLFGVPMVLVAVAATIAARRVH